MGDTSKVGHATGSVVARIGRTMRGGGSRCAITALLICGWHSMADDDLYSFEDGDGDWFVNGEKDPKTEAQRLFERLMREGRVPELLFRGTFARHVVDGIYEMFGDDALLELLVAIDRKGRWETEIIAEQADVDNILMAKYGAFDDEMWEKIQDTNAWKELHREVFDVSKKWIETAIDEVMNQH